MSNPLLETSALPFGAPPFDAIRNEHFESAFEEGFSQAKKHLTAIKSDRLSPSFENTIEALEASTEHVDHVAAIFSNLLHAHTNEYLQELAKRMMPRLAQLSNDIHLDPDLFKRVKSVYENSSEITSKSISKEDKMLIEKTYKAFVRNGALLSEKDKSTLREIDERLAVLNQQFSDNVLKAMNVFELVITDRKDLAGLPASLIEAAAATAEEKGRKESWVFTLHQPSLLPFLKFSERRELREKMWMGSATRATSGDMDNRAIAIEITKLRHRRARLLGYETHAHFVLEERMASNPSTVRAFLDRLLATSRSAAQKDLDELRTLSGLGEDFKPWDFAFYSEKLKRKKFDLDEEKLRPYFSQEKVIEGAFHTARRLYGLVFKRRMDIPLYHPDVRVYEVCEGNPKEGSGGFLGLLYGDFFPRASKQSGAWMTSYREQGLHGGRVERPHVSIVCNNTKPTSTRPSLLTLDEVKTIFHEFGHALHALLSQCRHRSLSGTNVYWDFVELPSQIMENWVKEKEGLDLFACHYETGEKMPVEVIYKIQESVRFQARWMMLRQVNFALLDMAWHANDPDGITDVETFETLTLKASTLFPHIPGAIVSCSFSHIFSGGYSSGYYSYHWAEGLDADAFELFKEKGIFSREVADRFRENVLSRGGSDHPMELYQRFRGRSPDPDALLRRNGLISS